MGAFKRMLKLPTPSFWRAYRFSGEPVAIPIAASSLAATTLQTFLDACFGLRVRAQPKAEQTRSIRRSLEVCFRLCVRARPKAHRGIRWTRRNRNDLYDTYRAHEDQ